MKKLLLLSALLIFACSSEDSSDTNDNNDNNNELLNCDGNPVPTIVYGTQEWTVENACHTTYRDGTPIPQVTDNDEWYNLTTGAWCYYDNDPNKGVLYNWYAVAGVHDNDENTPNKEFAPVGWHVPSDEEWTTFEEFLISSGYNSFPTTDPNSLGKALASTTGWMIEDTFINAVGYDQSSNNSSGFNAFPVGTRGFNGSFFNEGTLTAFLSLTENNTNENFIWDRHISWDHHIFLRWYTSKWGGQSVRLVKD